MRKSNFDLQSPERVLKQAEQFRQTLTETLPLPVSHNKSMIVQKVADYDLNEIKYSISRAQYQNSLFRKLQKIDQHNRKKISQSLLLRQSKIEKNVQKNHEKQHTKHQLYNKHFVDVQKRYDEEEKKKFQNQKEEALKLRKEIREFYEKQELRKKQAQQRQIKVSTCYSNALERIQKIQRENEEFAQKSELELQKSFIRNSPQKKKDLLKLRSTSLDFRKNEQIYQNSMSIFKQKQHQFIQKYAKNEASSLNAFEHKEDENEKIKKKVSEKIKKDMQRWAQQKKRIDEQKAQIPTKCTSKIEKSLQSTFRHTFSSFRDSFSNWRHTGELNRSRIKQKDDRRKDQIMGIHEDITLKNKSIKEVDTKMLSMKQRATKVAVQYS